VTGPDLKKWTPRSTPGSDALSGTYVRLEPLDWAAHGDGLFAAVGGQQNAALWEFVSVGPFTDCATFEADFSAVIETGPQKPVACMGSFRAFWRRKSSGAH